MLLSGIINSKTYYEPVHSCSTLMTAQQRRLNENEKMLLVSLEDTHLANWFSYIKVITDYVV